MRRMFPLGLNREPWLELKRGRKQMTFRARKRSAGWLKKALAIFGLQSPQELPSMLLVTCKHLLDSEQDAKAT